MARLLLDTNILIDHLRGDPTATTLLRDVETGRVHANISVITETELLSSASLARRELRDIHTLLSFLPTVAVTSRIARTAAALRRTYHMDLPDALIAATAHVAHATLVTRNLKHFRQIKGLRVETL